MNLYEAFLNRGWQPQWDKHPSESPLEMVLVEPRKHPHLEGVLKNMSCLVPNASLTIFHSQTNEAAIRSIVKGTGENNIRMIKFVEDNIDRNEYSKYMMHTDFWGKLRGNQILIFQTDTALRYNNLLRFMEYDYIGAPWNGLACDNPNVRIGNGGFSLRTRSYMEDIIQKHPCQHHVDVLPEDVYFAQHVVQYNQARIPSIGTAAEFSLEFIQHPTPMAMHKAWTFEGHSTEYLRHLLTDESKLAPITKQKDVRIMDAWVESQNGYINKTYNLVDWLSIGISTDGLRMAKDTFLSPLLTDPFPGHKKYLKLKCFVDHELRLYTIRLHQNRTIADILI